MRRWNKENIVNNKEHDEDEEEVFRAAGISSREHIHLLRYLNFK
jgi:hypothetical protein